MFHQIKHVLLLQLFQVVTLVEFGMDSDSMVFFSVHMTEVTRKSILTCHNNEYIKLKN